MDKHMILSLFHVILIFPILMWISLSRAATPEWLYTTLLITGCIILAYHGYKFITRFLSGSSYAWVNAIHVFVISILLIIIGWKKKETPRMYYELLLLVTFGGIGYHLFSLVRSLDVHNEKVLDHTQ